MNIYTQEKFKKKISSGNNFLFMKKSENVDFNRGKRAYSETTYLEKLGTC